MNLTIYTSDVRNFDEEVDKHFDVKDWHGSGLFDKDDRLSLETTGMDLNLTHISV